MTIIEKIKQSVEGATGMPFLYHAAGELNELIARCKELPVAYSFLIDSGTIDDVNGRYHERVTLAVMFCDKTEFDFNALENEQIIDRMKVKAYKWMQSLRMSNVLRVVSINNTQRLYDNTTDILTGFAVNITIDDIAGAGECELPEVVIDVDKNGSYDVVGVDKVRVNVVPKLEELEITENGEYLPPTDIAGFSKVNVDVQPVLEELTITENGEYTPQDGVYGFSKVVANVVPTNRVVIPSGTKISNTQIIDGYWAGELVDTSTMTDMYRMFRYCSQLQSLDVSNWDVSNVTSMNGMFEGCSQLQSLDVSKWDVSNATLINAAFTNCSSLEVLDVSKWDTRKVKSMGGTFQGCSKLTTIDVSKWDTSSLTYISGMFQNCKSVKSLDMAHFDVSRCTSFLYLFAYCSSLENINCKDFNTSNVTDMSTCFGYCSSLKTLDLTGWNMSKVTRMEYVFTKCTSLEVLDITGWNMESTTGTAHFSSYCDSLQSIIGNRTIEEVIADNIATMIGLSASAGVSFAHSPNLDRASMRAIINGVADMTGKTALRMTFHANAKARLTEEDIAIATAKNWTIA